MGQRHQIFVRIPNPVKYGHYNTTKEKKEAEKEFGTQDTTVLAYHNQWLYGRGALQNCLSLLMFAMQFTKASKTDKKDWGSYDCPFTINGLKQNFTAIKAIETIAFVMNFRAVKTAWLDAGIGNSFYIGKEDEGIREDFTRGDNNDGITIIDLIENKYCFMNIYKQDKTSFDVLNLPKLKPVSARAYVAAYYGETIAKTNPYYLGDHDRTKITISIKEQQKIVDENIETNKLASEGFERFEVLTIDEIQAMFSKMKLVKKKAVKELTK